MNINTKWTIILFCTLLMTSCATDKKSDEKADKPVPAAVENNTPTINANDAQNTIPTEQPPGTVNVPAGPDGVVAHYICADGCAGGTGENAGPCPVCGKTMAHNQAFHAQPASDVPGAPITPPAPEPAQNAQGVWHYTCANGCVGGGGSAGPCAICGSTLVHNAGYHN